MSHFADRVKDTTTTTGTGAITLAGAPPTGFVSFATAFGSSGAINVGYGIDDGAGNWEIGKGVFNGTTGLTRDIVRSSSTGGALINFGAGTKTVYVTASSEAIDNTNLGMQFVMSRCIYTM